MTAPGKYMSQLAVREQGWEFCNNGRDVRAYAFVTSLVRATTSYFVWGSNTVARARPFDYEDVYVGEGTDRPKGVSLLQQIHRTTV